MQVVEEEDNGKPSQPLKFQPQAGLIGEEALDFNFIGTSLQRERMGKHIGKATKRLLE